MGEQLKAKDELIVEMKQQIVMSNKRITQFMAKIEKLSTAAESCDKQNNCNRQKSAKMQGNSDTAKGLKAVFNTEYTPRYYTVNIEYPNLKRDLCSFKVEECLVAALGGKPKQITKAGKNVYFIEVCLKEQADKVIKMEIIGDMKCSVKEHSFYNECKGMILVYNNEIIDV